MATRTLYLIRHGEYDWDDQPTPHKGLTRRGRKQARLTARRLRTLPATAIYSSDLRRAVETAEIIRGPATPMNRASGNRSVMAAINPPPSASPDASPATNPIRTGLGP